MSGALAPNPPAFAGKPHHFDHLRDKVLPPLLANAKRGGSVRIWSAACSNGQEPYSIALTILSMMPDATEDDIKVLAAAFDAQMVTEAGAAVYSSQIGAAVPGEL